jgi:hypothetical protein
MKAPEGAADVRQCFAESSLADLYRRPLGINRFENLKGFDPKTRLDRDKPGYSAIKRFIISSRRHDLSFSSLWRKFPVGIGESGLVSRRLNDAKTRVNTLKYACARLNSATGENIFSRNVLASFSHSRGCGNLRDELFSGSSRWLYWQRQH